MEESITSWLATGRDEPVRPKLKLNHLHEVKTLDNTLKS